MSPYATTETRWFYPGRLPAAVLAWFEALGPAPNEQPARTDYYLQPTDAALNVKVREGHLETKRRAAPGTPHRWPPDIEGVVELWQKWSFALADVPRAMGSRWHAVRKRRRMRIYQFDGSGEIVEVTDGSEPEAGCEVELSELDLDGQPWWSFCFEAFGPASMRGDLLRQTADHVFALIPPPPLTRDHSLGYAAWLSRDDR